MTLRDKMLAVIADVNASVAEREELVEMIAIALLTRKNLFVLGRVVARIAAVLHPHHVLSAVYVLFLLIVRGCAGITVLLLILQSVSSLTFFRAVAASNSPSSTYPFCVL